MRSEVEMGLLPVFPLHFVRRVIVRRFRIPHFALSSSFTRTLL